jgi:uncharacterized protein YndB with AHSA1/START domain
MNSPGDLRLTLVRQLPVPRQLVYEAWTRKEHLDQWCAPTGFTVVNSSGDMRPGGVWHSQMRAPSGESFVVGGVYRKLIEGEGLVFTHRWQEAAGPGHETIVTVSLTDAGDGTAMTFEQGVFNNEESRESHASGWQECFDRLAEYLESLVLRETVQVRELPVNQATAFAAWTEPGQVAKWWGPPGLVQEVREWDARPGGRLLAEIKSPDGKAFPTAGRFEEVVPPERLVFACASLDEAGRPVCEVRHEVAFSRCANGTRLKVHARVSDLDEDATPYLSVMQAGWTQTLDRLAAFLGDQAVS